jgi:hypothetical protein
MKPRALMVTPTLGEKEGCGVGLYGKHWATALLEAEDFDFAVLYTDSMQETLNTIYNLQPDIVFYMWNRIASGWMENPVIKQIFPKIKHVNICVDTITQQEVVDNFSPEQHNGGFDYLLVCNPTLVGNDKVFVSSKLLPPAPTIPEYTGDFPIIGYHGFALGYKGIARLASVINDEFDEAIFRLHMPRSWFMDHYGEETAQRKFEISRIITKPGIKVEYTHHMMEPQEMVNWLSQNSINCYFYDRMDHAALASSTDYALAARRPIAVSRSNYFKDFFTCNPSVVINEPHSLKEIIANGIEPLKHLHESYTKENFIKNWSVAINKIISA